MIRMVLSSIIWELLLIILEYCIQIRRKDAKQIACIWIQRTNKHTQKVNHDINCNAQRRNTKFFRGFACREGDTTTCKPVTIKIVVLPRQDELLYEHPTEVGELWRRCSYLGGAQPRTAHTKLPLQPPVSNHTNNNQKCVSNWLKIGWCFPH